MNDSPAVTKRPSQAGPPLVAPALAYAALTLAGLALGAGLGRPDDPPAETTRILREHGTAATVLAAAVTAAAITLAIWSTTVYRRLRRLGVTAPGSAVALVGGVLASGVLAPGLVSWTAATTAPVVTPEVLRALSTLSFAAGGPGFVPFSALLVAGVAVPGLLLGLLPRVWAWIGLALAGVSALGVFALLTPALYPLLPVGRFGGIVWLVAASLLLPSTPRKRSGRG